MFDKNGRIQRALSAIDQADYLLIGGGAGLSDAAGLKYTGERFTSNFALFIEKYGFTDLYTSSFYPFQTQEERWAYWAKHISLNRYDTPATALYRDLFRLAQGKDYFVVTTNVEHQFIKAGFPEEKVFQVQGDYGLLQCERGCHDTLYDNETQVAAMIEQMVDCRVPTALVPKCPVCGGEMDVNLRCNEFFVEDARWHESERRFAQFLKHSEGKRVVYFELGVGFNTPGIIRFPFERLTYQNPDSTLIRVNRDYPDSAKENEARTIAFTEDMAALIRTLADSKQARLVSIYQDMDGGENMSKLDNLNAWANGETQFSPSKSAQGVLDPQLSVSVSCGASCGAGDGEQKEEPKPSACGASCGAGDQK